MKKYILILMTFLINNSVKSQCTLNNFGGNNTNTLTSTGNISIDNILKIEKTKLESFFDVTVDLKIYSGSNGQAKKSCKNLNCKGTIELGNQLLIHEYKKQGPVTKNVLGKNMVIAIMAHEFSHIFQYTHPEFKFKSAVIQEIHADLLAGLYMALYLMNEYGVNKDDVRYKFNNRIIVEKINEIILDMKIAFGWMGDEQYWSTQHHGDYSTRISSFGEAWNCMYGNGTQIDCYNLSDWLNKSIWIAESKYLYEKRN
jgi:hypothetical protein